MVHLLVQPKLVSRFARSVLLGVFLHLPFALDMAGCDESPQDVKCKAGQNCSGVMRSNADGGESDARRRDAAQRAGARQRDAGQSKGDGGQNDAGQRGSRPRHDAAQGGSIAQGGTAQGGRVGKGDAADSGGGGGASRAEASVGSGGAAAPHCGPGSSVQCDPEDYCQSEPDMNCGSVALGGRCVLRDDACADIGHLVCGCDGHSYGNECEAHMNGIAIKHVGGCSATDCIARGGYVVHDEKPGEARCNDPDEDWSGIGQGLESETTRCCYAKPPALKTCGGTGGLKCADGEYCNQDQFAGTRGCGAARANATGVCRPIPKSAVCTRNYRTVCGCDRRTYNNACEAHAQSVSVMSDDACSALDCAAIGGRVAYGNGAAPTCHADETEHTWLANNDGRMPVEGALCCVPK